MLATIMPVTDIESTLSNTMSANEVRTWIQTIVQDTKKARKVLLEFQQDCGVRAAYFTREVEDFLAIE